MRHGRSAPGCSTKPSGRQGPDVGHLEDALDALLDLLDDHDVGYMLVGGIALEGLGVPRSTLDIDVQVRVEDPPSISETSFLGRFIEDHAHDDVFDQKTLTLIDRDTGVPFALFITGHWFTEQAFDRRETVQSDLLDRDLHLPTPEDFLLLKACYWQAADRPAAKANQDELDIEGVIAGHQGSLDVDYLEANGQRLDVREALAPKLTGGER